MQAMPGFRRMSASQQQFLALLGLLVAGCFRPALASAQDVRQDTLAGWNRTLRRYSDAAERQNRSDWPWFARGRSGTRVMLTVDPRDADITLLVPDSYGLDRLLAD